MSQRIRLCHLDELDDGQSRGFDPLQQGRDSLFLIRQGTQVFGYRNACPHRGYQGTSMAWKKDAFLTKQRDRILCAAHGAQFDIASGECVVGPCIGQSLEKLRLIQTEQGELYLQQE